jgi:hypothetical protein
MDTMLSHTKVRTCLRSQFYGLNHHTCVVRNTWINLASVGRSVSWVQCHNKVKIVLKQGRTCWSRDPQLLFCTSHSVLAGAAFASYQVSYGFLFKRHCCRGDKFLNTAVCWNILYMTPSTRQHTITLSRQPVSSFFFSLRRLKLPCSQTVSCPCNES